MSILKKIGYMGLGAILQTSEKAEEIIQELIKDGELTQDEANEFFQELSKKGEKTIDDALNNTKFATKEDIDRIEKKLDQILKILKKIK